MALLRPVDLPRNAQGVALIGDPRNDSHLVISQLHVAMLRFHNAVVDWLRAQGTAESVVCTEAQRLARWHSQWVVLLDFLPRLVGEDLAGALLMRGPRDVVGEPSYAIPLEFADAVYRYGHSQIRRRYQLNATCPPIPLFPELVGFAPAPAAHTIDWAHLFDLPGHAPAQRVKRIDGRLARSLIELPLAITGEVLTTMIERDPGSFRATPG